MTRRADRLLALGAAVSVTLLAAACSSATAPKRSSAAPPTSPSGSASAPTTSTPAPATTTRRVSDAAGASATDLPMPAPRTSTSAATRARTTGGGGLPLHYSTGSAQQVITVTAPSTGSTVATLQAWDRTSTGWRRTGPSVTAHLGSDGLSRSPSESKSATPIGSFTLTQAFGHDSDPGTALPYTHTTPNDWWISQSGPLYNTRQRCASGCGFTRGDPNEHLYYETPYYDYAVVIDYNTANAPGGVRQGAGSAFFLHVTDGAPTAGCVSIAADQLVRIMRWLDPADHPRIVIGTN